MPRDARYDHTFANATRDELWLNGMRVESRLSHGVAIHENDRIVATGDYDEELVHRCDESIATLRKSVVEDARMRLVASARRVRDVVVTDATITTTIGDRKSTRLNSSHANISYAVFCLKKKKKK